MVKLTRPTMNSALFTPLIRIANRYGLFLVLALALAVRLTVLFGQQPIETDGITYIDMARHVSQGHWNTAFAKMDFTLYPVLIAWTQKAVAFSSKSVSLETAGLLVNLACGMALLLPLFALARRYFGTLPALAVGVYLAILPPLVYVTCNVLREGPFLCLICWALYLFITAIQSPDRADWQMGRLSVAGLLVFVAALIRAEGLGVLACMGITLMCAHATRKHYGFHQRTHACGAMLMLMLMCAVPTLWYIQSRTGTWYYMKIDKLSQPYVLGTRPTTTDPVNTASKDRMFRPDGTLDNNQVVHVNQEKRAVRYKSVLDAWDVMDATWKSCHGAGLLAILLAIWLLIRRRGIRLNDPLIPYYLSTLVLYGAVFYRYASVSAYLSTRHVMIVTLPAAVLIAVPFSYARWLKPVLRNAFAIFAAVAVLMFVIKSFKPKNDKYNLQRTGGVALAAALPANAVIAVPPALLRVGYYSQRAMTRFYLATTNLPAECTGTNSYLLFNTLDGAHVACISNLSSLIVPVEITLPPEPKLQLALFQAAPLTIVVKAAAVATKTNTVKASATTTLNARRKAAAVAKRIAMLKAAAMTTKTNAVKASTSTGTK